VLVVNDEAQYLVKFTKDVSFLHKAQLRRVFEQIPTSSKVVIDGTRCQFVDADIVETIEDFLQSAPARAIEVELKKTSGASTVLFRKDPD
jgi:MFS superfamily sulfate permease-like transporter